MEDVFMVKKMNAFNIQKAFVAIALMAFTLFFVGKNEVSASTTSNYYVSDPNSAMYGKVLKLYYDDQGKNSRLRWENRWKRHTGQSVH